MKKINYILIAFAALGASSVFAEGGNVGNGGIALVCRNDPTPPKLKGEIRYARLLDLWAADSFETNNTDTSWVYQLNQAIEKTRKFQPFGTELLNATVNQIIKEEVSTPEVKVGAVGFSLPDDFMPSYVLEKGCAWEAMGRYEYIPELGRDGLRKNPEIFSYFESNGETNIAAFYYHEGLYKLYRGTTLQSSVSTTGPAGVSYDSRIVQGLVAVTFSDKDFNESMKFLFSASTVAQMNLVGIKKPNLNTVSISMANPKYYNSGSYFDCAKNENFPPITLGMMYVKPSYFKSVINYQRTKPEDYIAIEETVSGKCIENKVVFNFTKAFSAPPGTVLAQVSLSSTSMREVTYDQITLNGAGLEMFSFGSHRSSKNSLNFSSAGYFNFFYTNEIGL